ncbi:putative Lipoprotein [Brevibacillus sp. IT-7CA2]|uniref:hypothetical protein n=1 Tax=Brevibacillus sp. IT-7CA2 TaxID=3026436 RepID=UPI0039E06648
MRNIGLMIALLFICLWSVPQAFAEEGQANKQNSSDTQVDLNLKPMTQEEVKQGFSKMQRDISNKGKSSSVPIAMAGLVIGVFIIIIGAIFSKRLVLTGIGVIGAAFMALFVLGDLQGALSILEECAELLRSWME